jgi:hypothetical protein
LYALYLRKTPSLITQKNALYFLATTSTSNFRYLRNESCFKNHSENDFNKDFLWSRFFYFLDNISGVATVLKPMWSEPESMATPIFEEILKLAQ